MADFRCELFEDPEEYEETLLRDRKSDFPVLNRKCAEPGKRAEFVRDVIALANTARMTGRPAYLLFGIDNHGKVVGIEQYLEQYGGHREKARQQMKDLFLAHIEPKILGWELKYGECQQKLVAYLLIPPQVSERPFCIKSTKELLRDKNNRELRPGSCWIRIGESKQEIEAHEIAPEDDRYRYTHSTVPYLFPSHWSKYLQRLLADPKIIESRNITPYVELQTSTGESLSQRVRFFLETSTDRLLVIKGVVTSGKSVFLNRLCAQLADENLVAIYGIQRREEFKPPPGWIPLPFSLRGRKNIVKDMQKFTDALLDTLNQGAVFWQRRPHKPELLFSTPELHWLVCLDGMDELLEQNVQRDFVGVLQDFMNRYPLVKILLTTRPFAVHVNFNDLSAASEVEIAALTDAQIEKFIASQASNDKEFENMLALLRREPELMELYRHPGYLVAAMRELVPESNIQPSDQPSSGLDTEASSLISEEAEQQVLSIEQMLPSIDESTLISKVEPLAQKEEVAISESKHDEEGVIPLRLATLVDRIYCYLWERERERWRIDTDHNRVFWESAGRLAIASDGKKLMFNRDFFYRYILHPRNHVKFWLLNLGILLEHNYALWKFCNELVKTFFAAWWVRMSLMSGDDERAKHALSDCTDEFRDRVAHLLADLYDGELTVLFPKEPM
jgi:hypothetical protein